MDLGQETDLLRKIPMFAKLDASKLKLLAFTSELVQFTDGDVVFYLGDSADSAYVIMDGTIDIVIESDYETVVAAQLEKNQLFGEIAILNNATRNATLKANGNVKAMKITADMFLKLLRENASMSLDVMSQLSRKLDKSHTLVQQLQQKLSEYESNQ